MDLNFSYRSTRMDADQVMGQSPKVQEFLQDDFLHTSVRSQCRRVAPIKKSSLGVIPFT
jgi:hypothetical protein